MSTVATKARTNKRPSRKPKARPADIDLNKELHGMRPLAANRLNLILRICDRAGVAKLYTVRPDPAMCPVERGNGCWVLEGITEDRTYWIADTYEQGWFCSCPGHDKLRTMGRAEPGCKHIRAFRTARAAFYCTSNPAL